MKKRNNYYILTYKESLRNICDEGAILYAQKPKMKLFLSKILSILLQSSVIVFLGNNEVSQTCADCCYTEI